MRTALEQKTLRNLVDGDKQSPGFRAFQKRMLEVYRVLEVRRPPELMNTQQVRPQKETYLKIHTWSEKARLVVVVSHKAKRNLTFAVVVCVSTYS